MRERLAARGLERLTQGLRDRVAGPVADLEQPSTAGAAAAGEPVTAVLAGEGAAALLQPGDRGRRLGGQHLHEAWVGRVVRGAHHVLGVELGRVVLPDGGLDAPLGLGGVVRLERRLRRDRDTCPGAVGGHGGGEPARAAADHEHVDESAVRHGADPTNDVRRANADPLVSLIPRATR